MPRKTIQLDDFAAFEISVDEPVFTSGVVCRLVGVPVWVLKQLDNEGIVCPKRKSTLKSRLYSVQELKLVKHCWYYMKEHRVKVHGLKVILRLERQG